MYFLKLQRTLAFRASITFPMGRELFPYCPPCILGPSSLFLPGLMSYVKCLYFGNDLILLPREVLKRKSCFFLIKESVAAYILPGYGALEALDLQGTSFHTSGKVESLKRIGLC